MSMKKIFKHIITQIGLIFGILPKDWEKSAEDIINMINRAKTFLSNPATATLIHLIPGGIGDTAREKIIEILNEALPTLEIAEGAIQATEGLTTPEEKAEAIVRYLLENIGKLPEEWQSKHWLDIARKILTAITGMNNTLANTLINAKYGEMKHESDADTTGELSDEPASQE